MSLIPEVDFTARQYRHLIHAICRNVACYGIAEFVKAKKEDTLKDSYVIMRHDVDGNAPNCLFMASVEADAGIHSTYYFRMRPKIFRPEIIRQIHALGHEVGYHYEVLADARGDYTLAQKLFEKNLRKLRELVPVKSACMHGSSLSKFDNLDFWKKFRLETFNLLAEPYLTIDYGDMYYFSDTGFCWDNDKFNMRDHVTSQKYHGLKSTRGLIQTIEAPSPKKIAILTHTNFWLENQLQWIMTKFLFFALNNAKRIMKEIKKSSCP